MHDDERTASGVSRQHLRALRTVCDALVDSDVVWVVAGSTAFALRGMPVSPRDIDLQTDRSGAYEIERRLRQFVVRPVAFSTSERIRSHFGELKIEGVQVEIMGDIEKRRSDGSWEPSPDLGAYMELVAAEDMNVPVLSLGYEAEAYEKLGRTERARMLREWSRRTSS